MANWLKVLLGIVVSAVICVGIFAWVADMHLMRDPSFFQQEQACFDASRDRGSDGNDCEMRFRARFDADERNDQLVAAGIAVAATGLFWLLVYMFYIKPRRRRAGEVSPPA